MNYLEIDDDEMRLLAVWLVTNDSTESEHLGDMIGGLLDKLIALSPGIVAWAEGFLGAYDAMKDGEVE